MPPQRASAGLCRFCGRGLSLLQQRRGERCDQAACRHAEDVVQQQRLAAGVGRATLQDSKARLGRLPAALLWLRDCRTRQVPVPERRVAAHRAFLQSLVDADGAAEAKPLPEPPDAVAPDWPQEGRLCAQCRGRCCNEGGPTNAFITLPQLLRWQQRAAGRTLQEAVAYFMAALPPRHTQHACVYQGAQGCSLPRQDRAEICNSYACDSLQQMRGVLREQADAAFAVVTLEGGEALRRAAITANDTARLRRR